MFKDKQTFKSMFLERLVAMHGKGVHETSKRDQYETLGKMVREYVSENWVLTNEHYKDQECKQVYYLSMEYLPGKLLNNYLINIGIYDICELGLRELGIELKDLENEEPEPGLGNGGLGRLASCFMDSLATLQLPGHGYGIRYKYGLFEQKIIDGYQVEAPDYWLKEGNVWEVRKSDKSIEVRFGGEVQTREENGRLMFELINYETVFAVPYDIPMVGYGNSTVNTLRLWSAESGINHADIQQFTYQNYHKILEYKRRTEAISEFLYPDDSTEEGKMLRLRQQYFMVSASLQNILRRYKKLHTNLSRLPEKVAIHINDTHPVLAIPELMRLLLDEEHLSWDKAWEITVNTMSYTNHTIMSEALEKWPISMMKQLLPRIYMIIDEINERFCQGLWNLYPGEWHRISELAIIADDYVKMAHLAIIGTHSINGVSELHSNILKKQLMQSFYTLMPERFNNKTNGITHRRWLLMANPLLAQTIYSAIGDSWVSQPDKLINLSTLSQDGAFQETIWNIKRKNKENLASYLFKTTGVKVNPESIFDVHIKRMHAYKRQLLNVFHIIDLYRRLKESPNMTIVPRTFIFGGKAAPNYYLAKNIVKLINAVADLINNDPTINEQIKVVFIQNYGVSDAERIIPAADLSEQISTASKEASGTGNMKFMMNGALTIGTNDGANIEMKNAVGAKNMFLFGLKPEEVLHYYKTGDYHSRELYYQDMRLKYILDQFINGPLAKEDMDFKSIYYSLLEHDEFFVLKDFGEYVETQNKVRFTYIDKSDWIEKSILNIAHSGYFSSDRTIKEYATDIWGIKQIDFD